MQDAVRTLRKTGELDNTLILFTTDNAFLLGEHRYLRKDVPYEQAMRTPLMMRGPGVPAGQTRDQTVTLVDLAPTLVDVARATPTIEMDGRSLMPVARDDAAGHETVLHPGRPQRGQGDAGRLGVARRPDQPLHLRAVPQTPASSSSTTGSSTPPSSRTSPTTRRTRAIRQELEARTALLSTCSGEQCNVTFGPL